MSADLALILNAAVPMGESLSVVCQDFTAITRRKGVRTRRRYTVSYLGIQPMDTVATNTH